MLTSKYTFSAAMVSVCQANLFNSSALTRALNRHRQLQDGLSGCALQKIEMDNICADPVLYERTTLDVSSQAECTVALQEVASSFGCDLNSGKGTIDVEALEQAYYDILPEFKAFEGKIDW